MASRPLLDPTSSSSPLPPASPWDAHAPVLDAPSWEAVQGAFGEGSFHEGTDLQKLHGATGTNFWHVFVRVVVVVSLVCLNLGSNVVGSRLVQGDVPPLLLCWFNVCWDIFAFSLVAFPTRKTDHINSAQVRANEASAQTLEPAVTSRRPYICRQLSSRLALVSLVLLIVFQAGNWLYFIGLQGLSLSLVQIIYQSSTAWVFVLSCMLLREDVNPPKVMSLVTGLAGIGLVAADNWDVSSTQSNWDMLALMVSAILWAFYEVLIALLLPQASYSVSSAFVGFRGLWNLLLLWPVPVILFLAQPGAWAAVVGLSWQAWAGLCLMATISVATTVLVAVGIGLTSPLFIRVGATLAAPATIIYDIVAGYSPGYKCYLGCALTLVAFVLINVPWTSKKAACTSTACCAPRAFRSPSGSRSHH